jgi:chemotaxis protein CheY-P-specific phosphatase CheC
LANALPDQFEFYHLGQVALQSTNSSLEDANAIAFHIAGDMMAVVVLLFAKGLDSSIYSELGNILVSRLATQLNQKDGIDLMISPPQSLTENQLNQIMQHHIPPIKRNYSHIHQGSIISIEALILPTWDSGVGNV